jgi:hypothetical protein
VHINRGATKPWRPKEPEARQIESTWESRDLPVLETVVRYIDKHAGSRYPQVFDVAEITGLHMTEVLRALQALDPTYVELRPVGHAEHWVVARVTDEARRAVGQWPTPEGIVDRLIQGLLDAADQEPDEQKRSRLRSIAEGLRGFARDVAVGVISNAATAPLK